MSAICEPAARFQDPIEHSSALAGLVAGLVVGAVVGAAIVFSGGAALGPILVAACTGASLGGTIGEFAGSFITSEAGHICSGAESVLIGGQKAARAIADTVDCDAGQHIAQGSETVFIERFPAARKSDKTTCGGTIADGFPNVILGSGRADYMEVGREVPLWLEIGVMVLGIVSVAFELGLLLRARAALSIATTTSSKIGATGKVGEEALKQLGGISQKYFRTTQGGRFVDQLVSGIAHESKVGYTSLTKSISKQIAKDMELMATRQIEGSTWHFFESPVTGLRGPSAPLRAALEEAGIDILVH